MLRRIVLWKYGIAVAVILGFSVFISHQDQKTRNQYEQKCSQLNARSVPPSAHSEDCEKGADNAARHLPRWYRVFGWPEGITAWAILLTLFTISEQTNATRKAATAAEENTRYLVNLERPWLFLRYERHTRFVPQVESSQWYDIGVINEGHTIAEIVGASNPKLIVVESMDKLPRLPEYGLIRDIVPSIRVQGTKETLEVTRIDAEDVIKLLNTEQAIQHLRDELHIFAIGVIQFRDLLSPPTAEPHRLGWCCRVKYDSQARLTVYLDGPKPYNYQT